MKFSHQTNGCVTCSTCKRYTPTPQPWREGAFSFVSVSSGRCDKHREWINYAPTTVCDRPEPIKPQGEVVICEVFP